VSHRCSRVLILHAWRWNARENASASSVLPRKCSVCSSRNPSKPLKAREERCWHCRKRWLGNWDDRHSENTPTHNAATVQHRAYAVSAVYAGCSSSLTGQLANATLTVLAFVSSTCRVSTLLIRWSRVRVSPDPPHLIVLRAVAAPCPTVAGRSAVCICSQPQLALADLTVQTLGSIAGCSVQRETAQS